MFLSKQYKIKVFEGADIEGIIREGYAKTGKKFLETTSIDIYSNQSIKSILLEADM